MNAMIQKIESMRKAGLYDKIVNAINADDCFRCSSFGLTVKGRCIQLGTKKVRLSEVEKCFKKAIALDPNCVEAMIELAWFYHSVQDNPKRAIVWFNKALQIVKLQYKEIRKGLRCIEKEKDAN